MNARPIIRARGLTKRFGDFTAVDRLTFEVAPGSIFAFLGANGSGKSTTIRMLIGLLTPTAGSIEVDGIDVIHRPRRVRDHIGYMGQRVSLYAGLTLRENVEFYAGLYGGGNGDSGRRWEAVSERFALREAEDEKAAELPAGLRQRAGLALSTLHQPRVLFLDEPTAGVDVENRLRFWELIQEEAAAGVTVFVTTHFLEEVEYCDWVCFIDAGRLIANAPPSEIRRRYSEGYRVQIALPAGERAAARALLERLGTTALETADGLDVRAKRLDPALLDALGRLEAADAGVAIETPHMTTIFGRLMEEAARPHERAAAGRPSDGAPPAAPTGDGDDDDATTAPPEAPRPLHIRLAARRRRLRTLMQREVRATLRDPFTVGILIAVPLLALLAFGQTLSTEVRGLALGVLDANRTAASRTLVAELGARGTFAPEPFASRAAMERALVAGRLGAALVIPPDFDRALRRRAPGAAPPTIQVLYDGAETILAGNAEAFLRGLVEATGARLAAVPVGLGPPPPGTPRAPPATGGGVTVVSRALFNPDLSGVPFMVSGTFGFVLTFLTTLITAVSIVNEKVTGTFEQLQVTPATAGEIVLGKILPLGAVFALDVLLMVLTAQLFFGVWPSGSVPLFLAVASFYVLISLAFGLILSATSATAAEAVQKTVLFSVPLIFLSGFAFPIRNMPAIFRWLAELLPVTHFIRITRGIYLRAEGPLALASEIGLLVLFGMLLVAVAFRTVEARQ